MEPDVSIPFMVKVEPSESMVTANALAESRPDGPAKGDPDRLDLLVCALVAPLVHHLEVVRLRRALYLRLQRLVTREERAENDLVKPVEVEGDLHGGGFVSHV